MNSEMVTMHQPNYLPWTGLFSKIALSRRFIIMDIFQYCRHGVTHRNKIRTNTGSNYLTIPVSKRFAMSSVREVELPEDHGWKKIHWRTIYQNYIKATYFKDYATFFEELYQRDYKFLMEFNLEIIRYLIKCFGMDVEILTASELGIPSNLEATDAIIATLRAANGNTYLSGPSGKGYLDMKKFEQSGLQCRFFSFRHPEYEQRYPGFEPNLSAIDLLFNTGPAAGDIIKHSGWVEQEEMVETL